MTMAARLTAFLVLISPVAELVDGEQGRVALWTSPLGQQGPGSGGNVCSRRPLGTVVLPPPPPQALTTVPCQVGPVVTYRPLVPVVPMPAQYQLGTRGCGDNRSFTRPISHYGISFGIWARRKPWKKRAGVSRGPAAARLVVVASRTRSR